MSDGFNRAIDVMTMLLVAIFMGFLLLAILAIAVALLFSLVEALV